MTKKFILEYLDLHKSEYKEKFGVEKIGLFGSYARDEANEDSDIDLLRHQLNTQNSTER